MLVDVPLALIQWSTIESIAMAAFGLGFVIFVHELGHFLVAKMCGVKCEKFYVGFDVPIKIGPIRLPRTLFRKQWGETEYGIGIVPLGGYVKMLGQDDNPANAAKEAERIRVAREQGEDTVAAAGESFEIDPRSYPAKTVPQRLAIISAGVVMNLIFAVIFGMIAYRMGVSYTPCVVGSSSPGLSAWNVGLEPGDRIVQMGREGEPSEHLRFDKDMMVKVMMTGADKDLDLAVQRYGTEAGSEPEWVTVRLSSPQKELNGRPIIGISPYGTTTVAVTDEQREAWGHLPAMQTDTPLKLGDQIVAVNGETVSDAVHLTRILARTVDEPLRLTIQRPADGEAADASDAAGSTFEVTIPVATRRWIGAAMSMGPIQAVQQGSPAEAAGFLPGDRIVSVNGQPVANPLTLPDELRRQAGQQVDIAVERGGAAEPLVLTATLRVPTMLHIGVGVAESVAVEALGIAYTVENRIASVAPGLPAEQAGLQPGDEIELVEFVPASEEDAEHEAKIFPPTKPIDLKGSSFSWLHVQDRLQQSLPGTRMKLTYSRNGTSATTEVAATDLEGFHVAYRGLNLLTAEEVHQVPDLGEAFHLGLRETGESMNQVFFILTRLITGQISPMNLGGPASIATMAGMEASESVARLLIFLTLLSANLAVLNFLPIPVLDGGHAMFLLYEGIFRKPLNERVAMGLTMAGFCFILGLMIFVIGLDVWRLTGLAG